MQEKVMKIPAILCSAVMVTAMPAVAEMHGHHHGKHKKMKQYMQERYDAMDTDEDGMVSKPEFIAYHGDRFDEIDSNEDGRISHEEIKLYRMEKMKKYKEKQSTPAAE
jgi:Ca2+-binding EF-hand superfamily protein